MDSLINGEISEESADKKVNNIPTEGSSELVVCNLKDDHVDKNSVNTISTQHVEKDASDADLPPYTSKKEDNIPQRSGSTENPLVQTVTNSSESIHTTNTNSSTDSSLLVVSEEEKSKNKLLKDCVESEPKSTGIQEDAFLATEKSESSSPFEQTCEKQSCLKTAESDLKNTNDLLFDPSDSKSNPCQKPIDLSDSKPGDTTNPPLDSKILLPSENLDNPALDKIDETSDESVSRSESNTDLCKNLTESKVNNVSNPFDKSVSISNQEHNSSVTCSESLLSTESSKKDIENDSSPLEQLNQHLKSIGYNNDDVADCGLPKENAQDADANKIDSLKNCQKDAACSLDRLKQSDSFVFTEISKEETGFPDIFAGVVVIGKYISVKGDFTLRSSEALVESPSLVAPYLLKEPDSFPPRLNDSKYEQRDFFHSTAGEMLIGIGLSRVSEWYHRDMTRIKKRQLKKDKNPELEGNLKMHESFYNEARKANKIYSFSSKTCEKCGFVTESSIVMEGHLLVPHVNQRREYQCNFCNVINRDPKAMLEHMYLIHGKTGRIQPPVLFFECPFCTYESNSKVKLGNHLAKCQRFYDPNHNQAPPKDFEFPALTPKPITVAVVKSYEKSMSSMQRGRGRPKKIDNFTEQMHLNQYTPTINHPPLLPSHVPPYRQSSTTALSENLSSITNQMISSIQMPNMNLRPPHSNLGQLRTGLPPPMHLPTSNRFYQVNSSASLMPMLASSPLVTSSQFPYSPNLVSANSVSKKVSTPPSQFLNSLFGGSMRHQSTPKSVPEVTITPLPKLHGPYPVPVSKPSSKPSLSSNSSSSNSLVVCEICDGYIKDLEQLRSHMQLIHKVKIHPKMLVSRPPLNCQKCQWRFFTDQGLERHLLGAHGLVTSNMQELANKSKDAGCCTICGRVFASKLVSHMNQVHKLTLKPAHLSYKCTVCSATFNLYRLFENHVYLVHSGAAKRPADGSLNPSKKIKPSGDYIDSHENEPKNHVERKMTEENLTKCTECGKDFRKHATLTDKCEKCLKCDVSQGTLISKMS